MQYVRENGDTDMYLQYSAHQQGRQRSEHLMAGLIGAQVIAEVFGDTSSASIVVVVLPEEVY